MRSIQLLWGSYFFEVSVDGLQDVSNSRRGWLANSVQLVKCIFTRPPWKPNKTSIPLAKAPVTLMEKRLDHPPKTWFLGHPSLCFSWVFWALALATSSIFETSGRTAPIPSPGALLTVSLLQRWRRALHHPSWMGSSEDEGRIAHVVWS